MDALSRALELLPDEYVKAISKSGCMAIEEIRLRLGRPPSIVCGRERLLDCRSVSEKDLLRVIEKATGASLHSFTRELSQGFVSYRGLRIGLCGTMNIKEDSPSGFRSFSSLAIRIPAEHKGICDGFIRDAYRNGFESTLILSPPGGGKTSALRELIRRLSDSGLRVAAADERNELAASGAFDLGACTDVLTYAPKAQGAMMLLKTMNPQIIAMDEISDPQDVEAISRVSGCGVGLLASVHAADRADLMKRPIHRALAELGVFSLYLIIHCKSGKRTYTWERTNP